MAIARALLLGACVVVLAGCASGTEQDSGSDAGCPGSPIPCCSGCNGNVVREGTCTLSGKWLCPDGWVSPADCPDAGVRWCGGVLPG